MREISREELDEVLDKHRVWLESEGKQGARAELVECDLTAIDLSETNLKRAILSGSILQNTNLRKSDLRKAEMLETDLFSADLTQADLRQADLWQSDMGETTLVDANLSGTCLNETILDGANLSRANIRRGDLTEATLIGANLGGASLVAASLTSADRTTANMENTNLGEANLFETNLRNSNLRSSFLGLANLFGANLIGTNLENAKFSLTRISDLTGALNLGSCLHIGPSFFLAELLLDKSIPDVFLEGIGVPRNLVEGLSSFREAFPIQLYSCFISYSHKNEDFAKSLFESLKSENVTVWYAPEEMKSGRKLRDQIDNAIRTHDKLLIVLSEESMDSLVGWRRKSSGR
ncbi:MAG: TIR domain-containing protein [Gammaproteobacteria bacterium]|nr:TIR domain-containing protein [Gammaproteobacteria bacterium]